MEPVVVLLDKGSYKPVPVHTSSARQKKEKREKQPMHYKERPHHSTPVEAGYTSSEREVEVTAMRHTTPQNHVPRREAVLNSRVYRERQEELHTTAKKAPLYYWQEAIGQKPPPTRLDFSKIQLGEVISENNGGKYKEYSLYYGDLGREEMWFKMDPI